MPLRTESAHKSIIFLKSKLIHLWHSLNLPSLHLCPWLSLVSQQDLRFRRNKISFKKNFKERRTWRRAVTSVRLLLHLGLQLVAVYQLGLVLVLPESGSMLIQGDRARIRQSGQSQGYFSSTSITFQFQFLVSFWSTLMSGMFQRPVSVLIVHLGRSPLPQFCLAFMLPAEYIMKESTLFPSL